MILSISLFVMGCVFGFGGAWFLLRGQVSSLSSKLEQVQGEFQTSRERVVALETEKQGFDEKLASHQSSLEKMEEKFRLQFENLANKIFDEKTSKFKKESEAGLAQLLTPLKERIHEFQKKVDESFGQQAKEQFSLKNEIARIVLANEKITLQAENLTNALKGDNKLQGNWGEIILEKILDDSGLRKDVDYILQGSGMGLKSDEGNIQKPDAIVMLPDDKHIVIDSKVSLTAYERYCSESADSDTRDLYLKQFIGSVKTHISGLEKRRYQDNDKLGTPDFVLMFIPIEGAYSLAVQADADLHSFAWDKKIVMVCPSTLFATLRTIASVWMLENQNRNALEIARQGGNLYDKIVGFVDDMEKIGTKIGDTQKAYDSAFNKLSTGAGNILKRTDDLRKLGLKTSKSLPNHLIDSNDEDEEELKKVSNEK